MIRLRTLAGGVDVWCDECLMGLGPLGVEFTFPELDRLAREHRTLMHPRGMLVPQWCQHCGGDRLVCLPMPRASELGGRS